MQCVAKKLKSQQGASLLLALLFFLICAMVSASILMAAVSNAGKIRSNKQEHQAYLLLSSAVQLVCDDLCDSTYAGQYQYIQNADGSKTIVQQDGTFVRGTPPQASNLSRFFLKDFDAIFASQLESDELGWGVGVMLEKKPNLLADSHTFTIQTDGMDALDGKVVDIVAEVDESYSVYLKASIDTYTMYAEITAVGEKPTLTVLPATPTGTTLSTTTKMKWKVGWISLKDDRT